MYQLRWATTNDYPFIANSYLKSYRTAPAARAMINDVYYPEYKARLEAMVPVSKLIVACSPDDPEQILGYVIAQDFDAATVLHYVYVKYPFRQHGIGKALVKAACESFGATPTVVTHQPKSWQQVSAKYQLIYSPSLVKETK